MGVEWEGEDVAGEVGGVGCEAVAGVVGLAPVGEDVGEGGGEDGVEEGGEEGDGLEEAAFWGEKISKGLEEGDGDGAWGEEKGRDLTYSKTRRESPKTKHPLRRCTRLLGYSSMENLLLFVSSPNRIDSPTSLSLPTCTIDLVSYPFFQPSILPHKFGLCCIIKLSCLRLRFRSSEWFFLSCANNPAVADSSTVFGFCPLSSIHLASSSSSSSSSSCSGPSKNWASLSLSYPS